MTNRIGDDRAAADSTRAARPGPGTSLGRDRPLVPAMFTGADLIAVLVRAEHLLVRHRTLLDRLDAELGDGDHGENMSVGFGDAVRAVRPEDAGGDVGDLMRRLGHLLVAGVGGAGGSLYGTAFIEAGITVAGLTALSPEDSARAFDAAAEGLARRGRCRLGDKTIYDALRPAADAFAAAVAAGGGQDVAALAATRAARAGMRATLPLVARRGLALRLGERSRGHQDPGATSCYLLVRSLLAAGGHA
jgi:dihydroxyacetone kinase-like protein